MMMMYSYTSFSQSFKDRYDNVTEIKNSNGKTMFKVQKNYKYGLCDNLGKEIIKPEHDDLTFYDQCIIVRHAFNGPYGVVDYDGNIILDCVSTSYIKLNNDTYLSYYSIGGKPGKDNLYASGGKYGIIAAKPLRIITKAKYDGVEMLNNKYIKVNIGGTLDLHNNYIGGVWGIVDANNGEIIKPQFSDIKISTNDLFTVNLGEKNNDNISGGGKWGVIDYSGNNIIPCEYDKPIYFKNDIATLRKGNEVKLIKNPLIEKSSIEISENSLVAFNKKKNGKAVSRYPAPNSEVDKDIPTASNNSENTFAFIVANENYPDAPVPYALNDGRMFANYCEKTLGIPAKNIYTYEDATYGSIISMVEKVKAIAKAYEGEASFIVYYAGHGFPDEKQNAAYILPIDGIASDITTTGYSLAHLYKDLSNLPLKHSIVFLDACFSGSKREDEMLAQSRGVAIKVKQDQPTGKMFVFSASQGDETAHQMEDKHHGLFTYFLLKGMQQLKNDITLGDLTDYVTKNVKRQSVVINNKKQTPTTIPSATIADNWRNIILGK